MSRPTEHVDADGVALKILLVEDDAKLADVLARFLRRAGYACAIAESGDKALWELNDYVPAGIVLDVMIPHPGGIEVCRHMRTCGYEGRIVVMSARSTPDDQAVARRAGADVFLSKPFALRDLLDALDPP
jgi:two-component system response regulator MprA